MILPSDVVALSQAWEQAYFPTTAVDNAGTFHAFLWLPTASDNPVVPYSAHQFYQMSGEPLSANFIPEVEYQYDLQLYSMFLFGSEDDPTGVLDKRAVQWSGAVMLGQLKYITLAVPRDSQAISVTVDMGTMERVNYQATNSRLDVGLQVLNTIHVRQTLPTV